jgi:hypothetical protein
MQFAKPVPGAALPAGHTRQEVEAVVGWYLFVGQAKHVPACTPPGSAACVATGRTHHGPLLPSEAVEGQPQLQVGQSNIVQRELEGCASTTLTVGHVPTLLLPPLCCPYRGALPLEALLLPNT